MKILNNYEYNDKQQCQLSFIFILFHVININNPRITSRACDEKHDQKLKFNINLLNSKIFT